VARSIESEKPVQVQADSLRSLCVQVFQEMGMPAEDARITADVLVTADLRGVDSHGVARLGFYVERLRNGVMIPRPNVQTVSETGVTALVDAGGGMGHPASYRAMKKAIQKALDVGTGFVAVRNSNHYGIAGYYAMMALEHDCIGISMTNAFVFTVPTFGRSAMLGTNPIAVAAPAGRDRPFVLDMATSTVPFGKLEVYDRLGKALPPGWAVDEAGRPATDPGPLMENLRSQTGVGGGLLPLGGAGELLGGHKGYGLALLVDVLCGVLSGACYADLVYPRAPDGQPLPSGIGHFFGALRVDAFRPLAEFEAAMDDLQQRLKNASKAGGQGRIYIHGEKEFEEAERRSREGIPLDPKVLAELEEIATESGVEFSPH
jgi:L-2-hydroxycarboxylate dehydrogenase (NAD+)